MVLAPSAVHVERVELESSGREFFSGPTSRQAESNAQIRHTSPRTRLVSFWLTSVAVSPTARTGTVTGHVLGVSHKDPLLHSRLSEYVIVSCWPLVEMLQQA